MRTGRAAAADAIPAPEDGTAWRRSLIHQPDRDGTPQLTADAINALLLVGNLPEWRGVFARDAGGDVIAAAPPAIVGLAAPAVGADCDRAVVAYVRAWLRMVVGVTFDRRDCADAIAAAAAASPAPEPRDEWEALADALARLGDRPPRAPR